MVNGLVKLASWYGRGSRRRNKSEADGVFTRWAEQATELARKLMPVLREAEQEPVMGLGISGREVRVPIPEVEARGPPRLVLLCVEELTLLGMALSSEVRDIEKRFEKETGETDGDAEHARALKVELGRCKKLAVRLDRLCDQSRRSKKTTIALP